MKNNNKFCISKRFLLLLLLALIVIEISVFSRISSSLSLFSFVPRASIVKQTTPLYCYIGDSAPKSYSYLRPCTVCKTIDQCTCRSEQIIYSDNDEIRSLEVCSGSFWEDPILTQSAMKPSPTPLPCSRFGGCYPSNYSCEKSYGQRNCGLGKKCGVHCLATLPTKIITSKVISPTPTFSLSTEKLNKNFADWFINNKKAYCFKGDIACGFILDLNSSESDSLHNLFNINTVYSNYFFTSTNSPLKYHYYESSGIYIDFDEYLNKSQDVFTNWLKDNGKYTWWATTDHYTIPANVWPQIIGVSKDNSYLFFAAKNVFDFIVSAYPGDGESINLNSKYVDLKALQKVKFTDSNNKIFFFFPTQSSGFLFFEAIKDGNNITFRGYFLKNFGEYIWN